MADQKSRGGQKQGSEKQGQGKQGRHVHPQDNPEQGRDMAEDARRGQQDNQGGYNEQNQNPQQ